MVSDTALTLIPNSINTSQNAITEIVSVLVNQLVTMYVGMLG